MKCDKKNMLLYAVTDRMWTGKKTLYEQIEEALKGGITCLQLREKKLDEEEFLEEALKIKSLCNSYNVPFIINDNVDIALKCGADGVHVGQHDMQAENVRKLVGEDMIIGVSARTVEQAVLAEKNGADYLGVGAVFNTSTKTDANSVSFQTFSEICKSVSIPIVAIGGISSENILQLSGLGADGVALVSAIFSAENIEQECRKLYSLSEKMVNG
ncbi:MAG: thiamine phosphate synthase [Acutalibacteraceae bacterium]